MSSSADIFCVLILLLCLIDVGLGKTLKFVPVNVEKINNYESKLEKEGNVQTKGLFKESADLLRNYFNYQSPIKHLEDSSKKAWITMKKKVKNRIDDLSVKLSQLKEFPVFNCPCKWPLNCAPISKKYDKEVMIFSVAKNATHWKNYDWKHLTTIVMFNYYHPDLMCLAHSHGVRVVAKIYFPLHNITNATATKLFIENTIAMVKNLHLDGVNFDIEDAVDKSDYKRINALTELVKKTSIALKAENHNYQISFDAAWSPNNIDDRNYDLLAISKSVDYMIIMAYDEQSQMREKTCIARANSGFNKTVGGVLQYIQKNIPKKHLILALPWYGYDYPCISLGKSDVCTIKKVPFHGVNCSDAAGKQISFSQINHLLNTEHIVQRWDNATSSPFFNYKLAKGVVHQVWYDDVKSLSKKYAFAAKIGLGGVGIWNADLLDYNATDKDNFKSMWNALPIPGDN